MERSSKEGYGRAVVGFVLGRSRFVARALVAAALLGGLLGAAPAAQALTRVRADALALHVLKPKRAGRNARIVVFGLAKPVGRGHAVFELDPTPHKTSVTRWVPRLQHSAWVFWEDLSYGAKFEHPSRLLLIDDRTGKVVRSESERFWPLIDGHNAPFVGSGYRNPRYQIYSSVPDLPPRAAGAHGSTAARAAAVAAIAAPAGSLAGECIVTIGHHADSQVKGDFEGLDGLTKRLTDAGTGLQVFDADQTAASPNAEPGPSDPSKPSEAADGSDLAKLVNKVINAKNCKDILLYIDGHGAEGGPYAIYTGTRSVKTGRKVKGKDEVVEVDSWIFSDELAAILKAHPSVGFKIKADSCFSGRLILDLPKDTYPNLQIIETSSNAEEESLFNIPYVETNGKRTNSKTNNPGNNIIEVPDPKHPGKKIRVYDSAHGRSEFTNGNLAALETFFTTPALVAQAVSQGGSLMARALQYGYDHSNAQDFAAQQGLTHPLVQVNIPTMTTTLSTPPSCSGTGNTCTGAGASCSQGASCTGMNAVCTGSGTTCSGAGSSCSQGADCTGMNAVCTGNGTACSGTYDSCSGMATCSNSNAVCTGNGTTCNGTYDSCTVMATCNGSHSVCDGSGTTCNGTGSTCTNGASCKVGRTGGGTFMFSGMYTQFTISNNMTANGFRLHLGGNRDYTGVTDPPGFTCRYDTEPGPTFYYVCLGNVMANATYSGTFDSSPSPAAGMGGTVEFTTDGAMTWSQPFTITGP